jgi:hypothetical protein
MKINILQSIVLICSLALASIGTAQTTTNTAGLNVLLYQTLLPVNKKPTRMVSNYFQKNAEIVDVSGKLVIGRSAIVKWFNEQKEAVPGYQADSFKRLSKHTRYLDPALRVKIIQSQVTVDGKDIYATCTYFSRRIDGQWYVESCTVVEADAPAK